MLDRILCSCQQKTKMQADIYQKTPCRAQTLQKEMISLHILIRTTSTFIYPQYRVLLVSKFSKLSALSCNYKYRIGGVIVRVRQIIGSSPGRVIPKTDICICFFSAKHTTLRIKSTDWFARNYNNVSEWNDMSTRGLLFQ